jgi:hypothetical protein
MKKRFLVLTFVALIGAGYFYMRRPPKFEGKHAGVHEDIWKFDDAGDPKARLATALRLQISVALSGLRSAEPPDLSESEAKSLETAKELVDSTMQRVRDFEARLTADDVAQITRNNPDSFFKYAGFFSTSNLGPKCTKERYLSLRESVGLKALMERGAYVGPLVTVYDGGFDADYARKTSELVKKESRFADFQDLASTHYELRMETEKHPSLSDGSRRKEYTEKLVAAGVEPAQVKDYAFKLAAQWPDCLGKISVEFFDFMNDDVTHARGDFLLAKLREYIQAQGKGPDDIDVLPVDKSDPVLGSTSDAWYRSFVLTKGERSVKLSSSGRDGKEGTADDILIGEISIP